MDRFAHLGDPSRLLSVQDHIVLNMKKQWPSDVPVPEGCFLERKPELQFLLRASREGLIANSLLLKRFPYSEALFTGCNSFRSSECYRNAAVVVLVQTPTVYIVHNRDYFCDLVCWFPSTTFLALEHDLMYQVREQMDPCWSPFKLLAKERCHLKTLVGSMPAMDMDHLFLSTQMQVSLFHQCPQLQHVESSLLELTWITYLSGGVPSKNTGQMHHSEELILGGRWLLEKDINSATVSAKQIEAATSMFSKVKRLEVYVAGVDALASIAAFRSLESLKVYFVRDGDQLDLRDHLASLLKKLCLGSLSLDMCGNVCLRDIARLCPKLKNLSLTRCTFIDEEIDGKYFPQIDSLVLGATTKLPAFRKLLELTSPTLHSLTVLEPAICSQLLKLCADGLYFPKLKELELATDVTVPALGLNVNDLHRVCESLPSLRLLKTDCYQIRVFFERYAPGRVGVSWRWCVVCAAEFPAMMAALRSAAPRDEHEAGIWRMHQWMREQQEEGALQCNPA